MIKHTGTIATLVAIALLPACAIRQDAIPVQLASGEPICVVNDPAVRAEVEPIILDALTKRGYVPRVVPTAVGRERCANELEYTAKWSWDFTIYMSKAELAYYQNGVQTGRSVYDSKSAGGMNFNKWVNAEEKLREMVAELFPA